jgi:hypothetical protein
LQLVAGRSKINIDASCCFAALSLLHLLPVLAAGCRKKHGD